MIIFIFLIIMILLILEFYFNYYNKVFDVEDEVNIENDSENEKVPNIEGDDSKTETFENLENTEETIAFKTPNPWCKISINNNDYTKYYIKLNNFNENKYLEWKKLIDSLDYDVKTKELILETEEESEALALVNLIISNMNGDIELDDILENRLISVSIQKAKTHKLVCNKLKELILDNNSKSTNKKFTDKLNYTTDMNDYDSNMEDETIVENYINQNPIEEKTFSNSQDDMSNNIAVDNIPVSEPNYIENFEPTPYGGLEYALI